jgi:flagellin
MAGLSSISLLDPQQVAAITRLQQIGRAIAQNNERLTTLRRINSASDDPAGLVSASRLESELGVLDATSRDLARATSLIETASTAAGGIVTQLSQARTIALAVAGGTLSAAQVAGKQTEFDAIIRAIDSLAATEFNGRRLLDGSSSFRTVGVDSTKIDDVEVLDKQTAADVAVSINVATQATQAANSYTGGTLGAAATVNVNGPQGTAAVSLANGATTQDITDAFNAVSYLTGVSATRIDASQVDFKTVAYGTSARLSFDTTAGTFNLTTSGTTAGTDAIATINGQTVTGDGSRFTVNTNQTSLVVAVAPTVSGAVSPFPVSGKGLQFVLGENVASAARVGLPELTSARLNSVYGTLRSVMSGGANSLTSGKAAEAIRIIDDALTQATVAQAALGSFQKYTLAPAATVASKTREHVSKAFNAIAGTDVALETTLLANNQLLQQATVQSLAMFTQQRQTVLSLLTSLASKA